MNRSVESSAAPVVVSACPGSAWSGSPGLGPDPRHFSMALSAPAVPTALARAVRGIGWEVGQRFPLPAPRAGLANDAAFGFHRHEHQFRIRARMRNPDRKTRGKRA
jgi:hypothetical protein